MDLQKKTFVKHDHVENLNETQPPQGSDLPIWKQKELRKLYLMFLFLFLGSTTLGYDASLLNGLQTMNSWQACESTQLELPD